MWGGVLSNHQGRTTCFTILRFCGGVGLREETMLLPGFWRFAQYSPHFQSFTHFPYVTSVLPAVALVLNPRVGEFA